MASQDKLSNKTLYRNTKQEPIVEDLLDISQKRQWKIYLSICSLNINKVTTVEKSKRMGQTPPHKQNKSYTNQFVQVVQPHMKQTEQNKFIKTNRLVYIFVEFWNCKLKTQKNVDVKNALKKSRYFTSLIFLNCWYNNFGLVFFNPNNEDIVVPKFVRSRFLLI